MKDTSTPTRVALRQWMKIQNAELRAEIKQLRAEIKQFGAVREEWTLEKIVKMFEGQDGHKHLVEVEVAVLREWLAEVDRLTATLATSCDEGRNEGYACERAARAEAEVEQLRALIKDLADDLEAEVEGHYPPEVRKYPSEQRRYERDMDNVYKARRALVKNKPSATSWRVET